MDLSQNLLADLDDLVDGTHFQAIERLLSQGDPDGRNLAYEQAVARGARHEYRGAVENVISHLERDIAADWAGRHTGRKIGMLCFCRLLVASSTSVVKAMPVSVVSAAVETGLRDIRWAEQFVAGDEEFRLELALLDSGPSTAEPIKAIEAMMKSLSSQPWRTGSYELTELFVPDVPEGQLDDLLHEVRAFSNDFTCGRARALAAIASRFGELEKFKILKEALDAARERKNTWGHAVTLLMVLPQITGSTRRELWAEFIEALRSDALGGFEHDWHELLRLADIDGVRPRLFTELVTVRASEDGMPPDPGTFAEWKRDEPLARYACRLAERKRFMDAYEVYRSIGSDDGRTMALVGLLPMVSPQWIWILLRLRDPAPSAKYLLPLFYASRWRALSRRGRRMLYERLFERVAEHQYERGLLLHDLFPYLTGAVAARALALLRAEADAAADPAERATALAGLAVVSPPDEQRELMAEAFSLVSIGDGEALRRLENACDDLLNPPDVPVPDRAALLGLLDDPPEDATARLLRLLDAVPADLIPLAWEVAWAVCWQSDHDHRPLARLVARMAELGDTAGAHEWLKALVVGLRSDRLASLMASLPASLTTASEYGYFRDRWTSAAGSDESSQRFWSDLRRMSERARQLPDAVIHMIATWCLATPPGEWDSEYRDQIAACLAPLYARAGHLEEAQRLVASVRAHDEKAQALAELAWFLPAPDRGAAVAQVRELLAVPAEERIWPESTQKFTSWMASLVGGDPSRPGDLMTDEPHARTLAALAMLLPHDEAEHLWSDAVEVMTGDEMTEFSDVMPAKITERALQRLHPYSDAAVSPTRPDLLPVVFSRLDAIDERQRLELLAHYLTYLASQGRAALAEGLAALAPVLAMLGGEATLRRLKLAVQQVGEWWP